MSTTPHNPKSGDDFDPWQDLEADLFGQAAPTPAPAPEPEPAPPTFASRQPPRELAPRHTPRHEPPLASASMDAAANEEEDDDDLEEDDVVEVQDEADEPQAAKSADAAPTGGKKPDAYWDALADWNWDEPDSSSSKTESASKPSEHRSSRPSGRGEGSGSSRGGRDRGDRGGRGREKSRDDRGGRGRSSERHSESTSASHESRGGSGRSESASHRTPAPAASNPPPVDDVWDDFGAGVESGSKVVEGESEPPRSTQGHGSSGGQRRPDEQRDASDDGQKRRRRRRRRRPGEEGPAQNAPQHGSHNRAAADRRTSDEYEDDEVQEPASSDRDYDEPTQSSSQSSGQAAESNERSSGERERSSGDRPQRGGRRRRRGRRDRPTFEQTNAPREAPTSSRSEYDDEDDLPETEKRPSSAEGRHAQSSAASDADIEVIDYGDMPTWEEAISFLLHPDQVEVDPNQQSVNAQRRAQAQEEGRSGSRHYGKRRN